MKKLQLLGFVILYTLLFSNPIFASALKDINGKVTEVGTNQTLPGATIYIPDLKVTAVTDKNGEFSLRNLPAKGIYLVEVRYIGYKTATKSVNFSTGENLHFELEPTAIEAKEIVITGTLISSTSKRNSSSSAVLNKAQLLAPSNNLIDALTKIPGVSEITTGPSISKPVIRGLGYNRIVTLDNGIKQQGQQWGDEHGIEIDQFKSDRVEVLRGAASLMYGSDALGGVINLLAPNAGPQGEINGEFISNYATNNGLTANSLMVNGNENGFVWRARGTYKNAYSFKTPVNYFPNSGFNETDLSGMVGLNKSWGYSHLNVSNFRNNIGFYEPNLDADGNFVKEDGSAFTNQDYRNRDLSYPRQDIRHFKIALNNNIILGDGYLKADLGYQRNQRRELDGPNPTLFFDLKTYTADLKYYINEINGWQPVFGLSMEDAHSQNKGIEFLVPAYDSFGIGAFAYIKKNWTSNTLNFGARYDFRKNDGKQLVDNGEERFAGFSNKFSNVSGALGFTHQFSKEWNLKANAGSAFRAPNPAELGSNGVHEGTFRYEIGNSGLSPEQSFQIDAEIDYDTKIVSATASIYNNYIHNYIYASNNGELKDVDGTDFPVYRYGQVNANLYGAEASLTIHPVPFLHFENTFGYVHAQNESLNKPLSFIPAASLRNNLRFEPKLKGTNDAYLSVGINSAFKQNRVDDIFETKTSGYTLLNAGIGATFNLGKQPIKLSVSGNNLLNQKYYDALSRFKPGRFDSENPNLGVYNTGRNITFGLYIPFALVK
ncbi:TonB-dependent receptor [Pedobacter changchengzhani]|uniref:TonB-dependent receptor n=1 Tax=Pedobacter changchengzhani TaxID=2529274 RepID=A0A4R5MPD9_9SPHI|nr:TonB-dependent receptor [Pedobacter changchengzhani]TDG37661.1 TonB-dependent receptor [Pedobacter changchengzhani]